MLGRNAARLFILALASATAAGCSGCDDKNKGQDGAAAASASAAPGLTPELAAKVLARVGEREITLGEYAATLERMDQFERLRYQSPERKKQLLEETAKRGREAAVELVR